MFNKRLFTYLSKQRIYFINFIIAFMLFSVTVVILFVFFIVIVPMHGVLVLENVHAHAYTLIVY